MGPLACTASRKRDRQTDRCYGADTWPHARHGQHRTLLRPGGDGREPVLVTCRWRIAESHCRAEIGLTIGTTSLTCVCERRNKQRRHHSNPTVSAATRSYPARGVE